MGLITKMVTVTWESKNYKWYESKGYIFTKWKESFEVKVADLSDCSHVRVDIQCDDCNEIRNITWQKYLSHLHEDEKNYCKKCGNKLFGLKNMKATKFQNSKFTFKAWCIDNKRQDILKRWDEKLNILNPDEITYRTSNKYWFKCARGLHQSELKNICDFTKGHEGVMDCITCNSFAQWGYDNINKNFLEKYWDYEENDKLGINPWKINYGSKSKKVYIFCQTHKYHESYDIKCNAFVNGNRCSYCSGKKVHPLDSLGYLHPEIFEVWSNKNKKSPYECTPHSNEMAWWKCTDKIHEDYPRDINSSNRFDFRCPECQFSKGEKKIEDYLMAVNLIKYEDYIPQQPFEGLTGLGYGNLSYDFYLPKYNLLIEYQGEQHEYPVDFKGEGMFKATENFIQQQEHDRRKREYAINNDIDLLEIWYWDFDNIEKILNEELKTNNYLDNN